ncbi:MAG: MFS transporter [Gammaproteobacteria bacterium]|nr:MFS transporter [Gammaproteobacteria bacterium]
MSDIGQLTAGKPIIHDEKRLSLPRLLALVFPAMPLAAMGLPLAIFVPPYYASLFQQSGMTAAVALSLVGTSFMIVRFFDLFTDPLMGVMGDRFESRWGRRRHWCVLATPVVMLGVIGVFIVPFPDLVSPSYLIMSMVVFYVGATMYTISHYAWGAEMSRDYHERSRITGYIQLALLLGNLTVLLPPAYMEFVVGEPPGGRMAVMAFGVYVMILLPIATLVAVTFVHERPTAPAPKISFWQGAWLVLKNRYMRRLLLADLMIGIPGPVMASVFIFFLRDVVGGGMWNSIILIFHYALTVAGVPFWLWVSHKVGKHRAFAISAGAHLVNVCLFLLLGQGDILWFALLVTTAGFIFAGQPMLIRSMAADTVDADNLQSGGQRTGLYFSLITMTQKVGGAIAIGVAYPLLGLFGFVPGAEVQTAEALDAVRYIYVFLPALALVIALITMWHFPLDMITQRKLRAELEERDRQAGLLREQDLTGEVEVAVDPGDKPQA